MYIRCIYLKKIFIYNEKFVYKVRHCDTNMLFFCLEKLRLLYVAGKNSVVPLEVTDFQ